MAGRTITSLCLVTEDSPTPLFVGREDGSIELYTSPDAACYGKPAITFYGHTKVVTAIVAPSSEEVFTCSMDGTVRHWSADMEQEETKRCMNVLNLTTPLRCLAMQEGCLYAGGDDGCLNVVEGSRRSRWSGHKDALSCIAFGMGDSRHVITGGYDNQIRVWDAELGKTIRLLLGHQNHVRGLRVVASGELLLSFGRDLVVKIWRLPEFGDEVEDDMLRTQGDVGRQATVSFMEPSDADVVFSAAQNGDEKGGAEEAASNVHSDPDEEATPDAPLAADQYRAAVQSVVAVKSAIKARPEPPIRQLRPVGTIELPETPLIVAATGDEAAYCYVGASDGYVLGINVRVLSRSVLQFLSRNAANVRSNSRETRQTLRLATRAIKKRCRKAILQKQRELLRAARKTRAAKRAQEREERAKARAAARAERAAARADEEDDEEEDDEGDPEEEEEEAEEEEDADEEEQEDPLALLDEAQREELADFRKLHEKERDEEIGALQKAASERNKALATLSSATFDTKREQFFRLEYTSYKKIGTEAVRALVAVSGSTCIAVQSHRTTLVDTTPGITFL